ncbi:hypothetical protein LR48_Vigan07g228700 [Vigna angularis]|uniref:Uncharacterized protein n=1 Tax=Phaseolus angularis TaxID=3914 RepID=A0A0L9V0M9_PHAAN|nr:hypothetical protein LR48_Vigan07g228700 [Vigna angularis]
MVSLSTTIIPPPNTFRYTNHRHRDHRKFVCACIASPQNFKSQDSSPVNFNGLHKSEQLSATRDQDDDSNVLIECRDVYKSFGEKKILNGVSFKVMGFVLDNGFGYITLLVMEEKTRDFRESGGLVFFFALSGFWELQVKEGDRARRFTVVFWMLFGFLLGISAKSKSIRFFSDINLLSSFGNKILQPRVPFQL